MLGAIPGTIWKSGCVSCKKNKDTDVFVSHPESTILPDVYVDFISPLLHTPKKARENLAQSGSILGIGKPEKTSREFSRNSRKNSTCKRNSKGGTSLSFLM